MAFLQMVSREEWGALPSVGDMELVKHPVDNVIYNHSLDVPSCETDEECKQRVQDMQKKDMESGRPDILYNFLIGGNGKVYEGRGWWNQTDKDVMFPEFNGNRIDIAYIGNFVKYIPSDDMILAADKLTNFARDLDLLTPTFSERQIVIRKDKNNKGEEEKKRDKEEHVKEQDSQEAEVDGA